MTHDIELTYIQNVGLGLGHVEKAEKFFVNFIKKSILSKFHWNRYVILAVASSLKVIIVRRSMSLR